MKTLWREHRMLLILSVCIILLQTVIGVALWDQLPDPIATHFDLHNEPNGWTSRAFTVFGMPLVLLALHFACVLISCSPAHMMKNYSPKVRRVLLLIIPATSLLMMTLCYGYALGTPFDIARIVLVFVGVIFVVTGNYLPKLRRNYTTGIKLPWTMTNDENWNRTHRMAAPIWVICGLLIIVMGLIGAASWIAPAAILAAVFLPTAYSFALHLKQKKSE